LPRWYIAQTPFRGEIYPNASINWDIWIEHWEHLATFLEDKTS